MKRDRFSFDPLGTGCSIGAIACAFSGHYAWGITLAAMCGTLHLKFAWRR